MRNSIYLFILLLCSSATAIGQGTGRLTGLIKNRGNETIAGANILLTPGRTGTVSDEEGRFRFSNINDGNYVLEISYIGYKTFATQVSIGVNENKEVDVILEPESISLGRVTVSAQKRSENQKEVPIALSSISAKFLENNVVETMSRMAEFVPGVQVQEQSVVVPGFVIRGLTSDNSSLNVDNRVSVFQDGISISKQVGAYSEFFDIDHVEVLKGPQGTLFGRSAQIGAIHVITQRAKNESSGNITLGAGNYNQIRGNGYVNLPLVKNKLFARVAGIYNKRDGYVENLSGGTLMGKNTLATRASFKYLPDKNNAVDLIFNYQRDRMPGTAFKSGTFAPRGGDLSPYTFVDLEGGKDLKESRDVFGTTFQYKHYFDHGLSITAITGYRNLTARSVFDGDGTKAQALALDAYIDYNQFSQELRLNYDGQRFSGFAGINYFHEAGNQSVILTQDERSLYAMLSDSIAVKFPMVKPIPMIIDGEPNLSVSVNPLSHKPFKTFHTETLNENGITNGAFDVFADGSFKVTPKFKITAGGRLIFEDLTTIFRVDTAADPGTLGVLLGKFPNNIFKPTDGRLVQSKSFNDWVGRFILQYDFSRQITVYASVSKGRRPNVIQVDVDTTAFLKAEVVYNHEIGIKNLLLNNRLQFNISGFFYKYRDFQTTYTSLQTGGILRIADAGKATGKGVETELQFAVTRNLFVFGNYAWLDARFDDKDSKGTPQKFAGYTFRLTPKHTAAAGLTYQVSLGKAGYIALNGSVTYKSGHFFEDDNALNLYEDGYTLLNAALQYTTGNGRFGLRINMNNIANERYLLDAGNTALAFGIPTYVPAAPRFFGAQLFINL
ncbi:MAG: TonB-dependent receptor [Bacteroidia bacterium]|nr:TonB-dependent receptor [Bacteroidia bacterium]